MKKIIIIVVTILLTKNKTLPTNNNLFLFKNSLKERVRSENTEHIILGNSDHTIKLKEENLESIGTIKELSNSNLKSIIRNNLNQIFPKPKYIPPEIKNYILKYISKTPKNLPLEIKEEILSFVPINNYYAKTRRADYSLKDQILYLRHTKEKSDYRLSKEDIELLQLFFSKEYREFQKNLHNFAPKDRHCDLLRYFEPKMKISMGIFCNYSQDIARNIINTILSKNDRIPKLNNYDPSYLPNLWEFNYYMFLDIINVGNKELLKTLKKNKKLLNVKKLFLDNYNNKNNKNITFEEFIKISDKEKKRYKEYLENRNKNSFYRFYLYFKSIVV